MLPGRQNRNIKRISKWIIGIAAACILIYLAASNISGILAELSSFAGLFMPLIIGAVIALVINVPMRSIEKRLFPKTTRPRLIRFRRPLAIISAEILVFGIFVLVAALVIPELVKAVALLSGNLLSFVDRLAQLESTIDFSKLPFGNYLSQIDIDWNEIRTSIEQLVRSQGMNEVGS